MPTLVLNCVETEDKNSRLLHESNPMIPHQENTSWPNPSWVPSLAVFSIYCLGQQVRKTLSGLIAWLLLQSHKPFQFLQVYPSLQSQYAWLYAVYIHPKRPLLIKSVYTLPWKVSRNHLRRINCFPGAIMPPLQMSANFSRQFPTLLLSALWAQLLFWLSEATLSSLEDRFSHQETLVMNEDTVTQAPVPAFQQERYRSSKRDLENQTIM